MILLVIRKHNRQEGEGQETPGFDRRKKGEENIPFKTVL